MRALQWLMTDLRFGDSLFFHFSGHGSQQRDPTGMEEDGKDETILPVDFQRAGQITDTELHRVMAAPLPEGVVLHAVFDCCHRFVGAWNIRAGRLQSAGRPILHCKVLGRLTISPQQPTI
jgi:hypothetical protein